MAGAVDLPDLRGKLTLDLGALRSAPAQVRDAIRRMQAIADGDKVTIRLDVDDADAAAAVGRARRTGQAAADRNPINLKVDVDRGGLDRAGQGIRNLATISGATLAPIKNLSGQIAGLAVRAGAGSAAFLGGTGLVGGVLAFGAAATQAAAAAPLLVTGLGALAAVVGTVKLATAGVGPAIKSVGAQFSALSAGQNLTKAQTAKLNAELSHLAPNARSFVIEVGRLLPSLHQLQQTVQQRFFTGLSTDVQNLSRRYLPDLSRAAASMSTVLNRSLRTALAGLNTRTSQSSLAGILGAAKDAAASLGPVLARLPALLLRIGAAGGPAFAALAGSAGKGLSGVFDKLNAAASSGKLAAGISTAIQVFKDLGGTVVSVLGIVKGLGTAAQSVFGTQLTTPVAGLAKALSTLVQSAPGQGFLKNLFGAAAPVLAQIGRLLVNEVLPGLGRLVPVAAKLASAFLTGLAPVIPVIERLASTLGTALASVLPAVSTFAVALGGGLAAAVKILQPVIPPLAAALSSLLSPTGVLTAALSAMAPVLPILAAGFGKVVSAVSGGLVSALGQLAPTLPGLASALANLAAAVGGGLGSALAAAGPLLVSTASALTGLAKAATPVVGIISAVLNPLLGLLALKPVAAVLGAVAAGFLALKAASAIGGVISSVSGAAGLAATKFQALQFGLALTGPAGTKAAFGLNAAGKALGAIGVAGAVTAVVVAGIKALQNAVVGAAPAVDTLTSSLIKASNYTDVTKALGLNMEDLGVQIRRITDKSDYQKLNDTFNGFAGIQTRGLREATQNLGSLDQALTGLVASGHGDEAARQFKLIADSATAGGASLDDVKKALPGYTAALANVANQATLSEKPLTGLQKAAQALGVQFRDGSTAADVLSGAIDRLNGKSTSGIEADIAYRTAKDNLTQSIKDNGRTLGLNSAAGRSNTQAVLDGIARAKEYAKTVVDSTAKSKGEAAAINAGRDAYAQRIKDLQATATAAGLPKAAVDRLIATYGRVPPKVKTDVSSPGADTATSKMNAATRAANGIPGAKATRVTSPGADSAASKMTAATRAANGIPGVKSTSVSAPGTGSAASSLSSVADAANRIPSYVSTTVETIYKTIGSPAGTAHRGVGMNAAGTDYWRGGLTVVGERGPELVELPRGSRIFNAQESTRIAANAARDFQSAARGQHTATTSSSAASGPVELRLHPDDLRYLAAVLRADVLIDGVKVGRAVASRVDASLGGQFQALTRTGG